MTSSTSATTSSIVCPNLTLAEIIESRNKIGKQWEIDFEKNRDMVASKIATSIVRVAFAYLERVKTPYMALPGPKEKIRVYSCSFNITNAERLSELAQRTALPPFQEWFEKFSSKETFRPTERNYFYEKMEIIGKVVHQTLQEIFNGWNHSSSNNELKFEVKWQQNSESYSSMSSSKASSSSYGTIDIDFFILDSSLKPKDEATTKSKDEATKRGFSFSLFK
jgi:hypothetical protein